MCSCWQRQVLTLTQPSLIMECVQYTGKISLSLSPSLTTLHSVIVCPLSCTQCNWLIVDYYLLFYCLVNYNFRGASLGHFEVLQVLSAYGANFSITTLQSLENAVHFATVAYKLLCIRFLGQRGGYSNTIGPLLCCHGYQFPVSVGCPTNEANCEGLTPQKYAKNEGMKDAMKELKKLSSFQDKIAKGGKPKGYAEPWSVQVRPHPLPHPLSSYCVVPYSYLIGYSAIERLYITH